MISSGPAVDALDGLKGWVEVLRVDGGDSAIVWRSPTVSVQHFQIPATAAAIGANWPTAFQVKTGDWQPGVYSADFVFEKDESRDLQIAQVIVRSRTPTDILFKLGTNTYQAYNSFGGQSLYGVFDTRGTIVNNQAPFPGMVSFDRPNIPAFFEYDVFIARFLYQFCEKHNLTLSFASDFDVHMKSVNLNDFALIVTSAHDEYWTEEMFQTFEDRVLKTAKSTFVTGANTSYWRCRYADIDRPPHAPEMGRQLVCRKMALDPITHRVAQSQGLQLSTNRFRDTGRPESHIFGVSYSGHFNPNSVDGGFDYVAMRDDLPFFEGTGLQVGDILPKIVGYEWDNRGEGRSPVIDPVVVFEGRPKGIDGVDGLAEAVFFKGPLGAKVFSTGSIWWCWGFGRSGYGSDAFLKLNENILLELLGD